MTSTEIPQPLHRADVVTDTSPYRIKGMPEELQLDNLDKIAGLYEEFAQKPMYRSGDGSGPDYEKVDAGVGEVINLYLEQAGFDAEAETDEEKKAYKLAFSAVDRAVRTDKQDWIGHTADDGSHEGVSLQVFTELLDHYQPTTGRRRADTPKPVDTDADNPEDPRNKSEALQEADRRLEDITKKYAEQVAERSKRMIEGAKTRADIEASKEELGDLIAAIATEYMVDIQGVEHKNVAWDDMPETVKEEIVRAVDTFIVEQTDQVIARMEEQRMAEYNKARPIFKKFYDKWAGWGQEEGFITKGKLKKAAVFAIPGAALGAALVPLAGVVGFGATTGALAVMGGRSIARRLAGAKIDSVADSKRVAAEQSADIRARASRIEGATHEDLLDIIDKRTEAYRRRNLRRTAGGLAIAMTVGLVTAKGADMLADNVDNWSFGKLAELNRPDADTIDTEIVKPDMDGDGIPDAEDRDRDGDGVRNGSDLAPNNPNVSDTPNNLSTRDSMFDGRLGTRELTPEGREALTEQLDGYKVKSGDSVWSLSEQFLHEQGVENPTTYEIDATKDVLLQELQASGNADARGWLTAGDTIRIK